MSDSITTVKGRQSVSTGNETIIVALMVQLLRAMREFYKPTEISKTPSLIIQLADDNEVCLQIINDGDKDEPLIEMSYDDKDVIIAFRNCVESAVKAWLKTIGQGSEIFKLRAMLPNDD